MLTEKIITKKVKNPLTYIKILKALHAMKILVAIMKINDGFD